MRYSKDGILYDLSGHQLIHLGDMICFCRGRCRRQKDSKLSQASKLLSRPTGYTDGECRDRRICQDILRSGIVVIGNAFIRNLSINSSYYIGPRFSDAFTRLGRVGPVRRVASLYSCNTTKMMRFGRCESMDGPFVALQRRECTL